MILSRLSLRSIEQIDLEFALDIIENGVITRIVNLEAIDIEPSIESTAFKTSEDFGQKFTLLQDEYDAFLRYKEHLSTDVISQPSIELPSRTLS